MVFRNPAGGVFYHYIALKYRKKYWCDFIEGSSGWLEKWEQKSDSLLLIGPSAGYCLKPEFLKRYSKVDVIDPDPLARAIFRRRFKLNEMTWDGETGYMNPETPDSFDDLMRRHPKHDILFANLLGQICLLFPKESVQFPWKVDIERGLLRRNWASFHDRFSTKSEVPKEKWSFLRQPDLQELVQKVFQGKRKIDLFDHQTNDLFPMRERIFLPWRIQPGRTHVIECVKTSER